MSDWIGNILKALGEHIRRIEDENAELKRQLRALTDDYEEPLSFPGTGSRPPEMAGVNEPESEVA